MRGRSVRRARRHGGASARRHAGPGDGRKCARSICPAGGRLLGNGCFGAMHFHFANALAFFCFALVFVIVDVELAFIYPVMAVYKDWVSRGVGGVALLEIVTFIGILAVGLVYVWAKGDLAWLRRTTSDVREREAQA